jgi:CO/xanthine dehydrogenase Mo-binding subunit
MLESYHHVGHSVPKRDGWAKLNADPIFAADIDMGSPLILKALRSTRPHATIRSINIQPALAVPGVVRVFTAEDIPGKNLFGIINKDHPLLAEDKVRSTGDAVALVAAESEVAAAAAVQAIEVDYSDLEAVFDPQKALDPSAPLIHSKGNLLFSRHIERGDVHKALAQSDVVIENTYTTPRLEHTYLEPDAGCGFVDDDGSLVIYASTQNPHYDHKEVVEMLNVPEDNVRIIQAATGGGFGSKLDLNVQGFIGLALYHLRLPVRYVYTREEAFRATAKRHPLTIEVITGADAQGNLQAAKVTITCDTGAYGSYGIAVASRAAVHAVGPYEVDNVLIDSRCVYTNSPFCGAMRGFGAPQAAIAHEGQMDLLAQALGMDPLRIREINALRPGSVTITGQKLEHSVGYLECLESVRSAYEQAQEWVRHEEEPGKKRGIGLGGMWYGIGNTGVQNPSTARVEMNLEGEISLYTGCADIGQGSTTVLNQVAAEVFDVSPEKISMVVADTRQTTSAGATSASRQTYISGNAVKQAAEKLADVLLTEAVNKLKVPKASLVFERGYVAAREDPECRIDLAWLARHAHNKGIPLSWTGYFDPETTALDLQTGQGVPYATYAFACQLVTLSVDVFTGEVEVHEVVAAHDVGKAIHPENVKGQICGGVAMGLGFALMEEFIPGSTESLKDYHVPTCGDMPRIRPIIVESEEPSGPFGAKGVGEPALIPTAPAILSALDRALGQRITTLPASLERVLEASQQAGLFRP